MSSEKNRDAQTKAQIGELQAIRKELDSTFARLLKEELSELEKLSSFTGSLEKKLQAYYAEIFPKKCNTCGRIYENRQEYISMTASLKKTSTIFNEMGLQEYRNCACGSTLIVWADDRRDTSEYGAIRRQLFDDCMDKLKKLSRLPEAELREKLRLIFSSLAA